MPICRGCQSEVDEGASFCPNCGTEVWDNEKENFCTECGEEIDKQDLYCPGCGNELVETEGGIEDPTAIEAVRLMKHHYYDNPEHLVFNAIFSILTAGLWLFWFPAFWLYIYTGQKEDMQKQYASKVPLRRI